MIDSTTQLREDLIRRADEVFAHWRGAKKPMSGMQEYFAAPSE